MGKIQCYYKRSIKEKQLKVGVSERKRKKKLILDEATRWNLVFFMIRRFVKMVPFPSSILLNYITAPIMVTALEMDILL